VPGLHPAPSDRRLRSEEYLDELRRTAESADADIDVPIHPPDEMLSRKTGEPRGHRGLYFMNYNFGRVHQTLRVSPAMEAGIADHVWGVEEIVGLLE
jgi:hypothetical protein